MANNLEFILKLQDLLTPGMRVAAGASDNATGRIRKGLDDIDKSAHNANNGISKLGGGLNGLMSIAGPLIGAFASFEFFKGSVEEYNSQAQAMAQLEASLKSTGGAAGLTSEALSKQAEALQKTTLYGDETTEKMQSLLLTFTNIKGSVFTEAVPAIQDLATKMGTDLQGAAVQVGKALNDPIKGITALQRVGVSFTESQKNVIKHLVETGQTAEAQRMILKELNTEFGGSAAAAAAAGAGPFKMLQNRFGETKEEIGRLILKVGTALMPVFDGLITVFDNVVNAMKGVYHWMQEHQTIMGIVITVVASVVTVMTAHAFVTGIASAATATWTGIQWLFNAALTANPIGAVILAIVALVAIIGYIAYATDGWGKQWDQLIKMFKFSWAHFKDYFTLLWMEVQDKFMSGLEIIERGWYKLKSLWDEDGAAAGLAKIDSQQNSRADEILKQKGLLAADAAGVKNSMTWEIQKNGKSFGSMTDDLKKKLGIGGGGAADPLKGNAGSGKLGGLGAIDGGGAAGGAKSKADGINSGGQRNITITIGKQIEKLEVHVMNATEGVQQIESMVREAMRRTLYSLNGTTA